MHRIELHLGGDKFLAAGPAPDDDQLQRLRVVRDNPGAKQRLESGYPRLIEDCASAMPATRYVYISRCDKK